MTVSDPRHQTDPVRRRAGSGGRLARSRAVALLSALLLSGLALAACGGDGDDDGDGGEPSAAAARWEGTFDSTFGQVTFRADGDEVTATYDYCGGELNGTATDSRLTGDWVEHPEECAPQEVRGESTETKGTFDFTLSPDDSSFTGNWRYASGARDPQGDEWEGRRVSGAGSDAGSS